MLPLLRSLFSGAILMGLAQWEDVKMQGIKALRRKLGGLLLLFLGMQFVCLAVGFMATAFFLGLAEVEGFVRPALITGGILLAIAVVAGLEGVRWLRS